MVFFHCILVFGVANALTLSQGMTCDPLCRILKVKKEITQVVADFAKSSQKFSSQVTSEGNQLLSPFRAKQLELSNQAHKAEAKVSTEFKKITEKTSKVMKEAVAAKSTIEQERTRYESAAGALQAAAEADLDAATQDASDEREKVEGQIEQAGAALESELEQDQTDASQSIEAEAETADENMMRWGRRLSRAGRICSPGLLTSSR